MMECNKIHEKFSAYIEEVVSSDEKILIDEHLKSCEKCRIALSDIKKTIEHIKNIEEVDPPSWLTQKIMAKVKVEAENRRGILYKLFSPLYIKVPIGAVATIAIAVTTIYIFKAIQSEIKPAKTPSEETVQSPPPSPLIEKDKALSAKGESVQEGKQSQQFKAKSEISKDEITSLLAPSDKDALITEKTDKELAFKTIPQEQPILAKEPRDSERFAETSHAPTPVVRQQGETMPSAGAAAKKELKMEATPVTPKARAMAEEKKESIDSVLQDIFEKSILEKHPNGTPKTITTYKITSTGKQKIMEEKFNDDRERHGIQREYYDSGQLKAEVEYNYGKLAWYMEFHPDGTKKTGESKKDWLWLRQNTVK